MPDTPAFRVAIIPVTPFQQNCAVLWEPASRACLVVDPGGEGERILAALDKLDLAPELILLTHGHFDHAGAAMPLKAALDARARASGRHAVPIIGPDARDRFLLDSIEQTTAAYGVDGMVNATPDRFLAEGETVTLGALRFDVLHCPGHTPGSLVFVAPAQRFAIVGDVLFQGSVGRTDFPYGDHEALIGSIQAKLLPLGDDIAFICGHGPGSTFGEERRTNPFVQA